MSKEDFLNRADAPRSIAEAAWNAADGEEHQAEELLEPAMLRVKCKFMNSNGRFGGLLYIEWSYLENAATATSGIVSSDDGILEIPIDLAPEQFGERVIRSNKTGPKMGGNTETLQSALSEALQTTGTDLRETIKARNTDRIEKELQDLLTNNLDITQPQFTTDMELTRKVQEKSDVEEPETSEGEEEESEEYEVPAEVEIDPVKGVPIGKVSIGDLIYVDLGNYQSRHQKIANVLNDRRDETGLIPAQLVSREVSEAGTLALRVQFGQGVYGKVRCGKDVSILVPEETAAKRNRDKSSMDVDPVDFIADNWVIIFALGMALIILLVVYLILAG